MEAPTMTTIQIQGYKRHSPYFAAQLLENGELIHTARCKTNYPERKISVEDNLGNQGSIYITFNIEADMHNLLKEWYDKQPN